MSEFTEKLISSEPVSNAWDAIDKDQANAGLLIDVIRSEFKDWQPPKKLVVVPRIVADFIKDKKGDLKLYGAFHEIDKRNDAELSNWVFQKADGQLLFARAWIDGYTVEKEQLYEVIINGLYLIKVMKYDNSKNHRFIEKDKLYKLEETGYKLTEQQIKKIDPRYMAFAVKVDEVEN